MDTGATRVETTPHVAWARAWFGSTAFAVFAGIIVQLIAVADEEGGRFSSPAARSFNVFCFFTIQSNLIVGVTSLLLAIDLHRTSTAFRVFRLTGVVAIAITGVIYHLALANLRELTGHAAVADQLLHTVVPILGVLGWVLIGPRGLTSWRVACLALVFPGCWMAFTLIRGPIVDFYPYPFVDVGDLGYPKVIATSVGIAVLFLGLSAGATVLDARSPGIEARPVGLAADIET